MSDINALCPPEQTITLLGRQCVIKPLSIRSAVQLGRILGQLHTEVSAAAKEGGETANILAKILELAGTNKTQEILNILTANRLKDISNLDDKLTLTELSLLCKAVCEVNDFKAIAANFSFALKATAATRFQAQ